MINLKTKSKLMLAGLLGAGSYEAVAQGASDTVEVVSNRYGYGYGDNHVVPDSQLEMYTGLSQSEIHESRKLSRALNSLQIVEVKDMKLDQAPGNMNRYGLPEPEDREQARSNNIERLNRLRKLVEASQGI